MRRRCPLSSRRRLGLVPARLQFAAGRLGLLTLQPFSDLGQQLFAVILAVGMMLVVLLVGGMGCCVCSMHRWRAVVEGGSRGRARGSLATQSARRACAKLLKTRRLIIKLRFRDGLGKLDGCNADVSLRCKMTLRRGEVEGRGQAFDTKWQCTSSRQSTAGQDQVRLGQMSRGQRSGCWPG